MKRFFINGKHALVISLATTLLLSAACSTGTTVVEEDESESTTSVAAEEAEETTTAAAEADDTDSTTIEIITKITQSNEVSDTDLFVLDLDGYRFAPKENAGEVLSALGDYSTFYEAPSCVFEGQDTVYGYSGFEVNTAEFAGEEVVVGMFITDESYVTPSGLHLGASLEEVEAIYGEPSFGELGQYTWEGEACDITIVFLDNEATSISYIGNFPGY